MFRSPLAFSVVEMVGHTGGIHVDENEILKGRCACSGVIMMLCRKIERRIYFASLLTALLVVLQAVKSVVFGLRTEQHFCS